MIHQNVKRQGIAHVSAKLLLAMSTIHRMLIIHTVSRLIFPYKDRQVFYIFDLRMGKERLIMTTVSDMLSLRYVCIPRAYKWTRREYRC